ncbi:hypothetical protein GPECTOR_39g442 [Gonium pectorale]|uniref:G-patch domain-containing protein n=1 Tax=Gonium pectorale TaxID=33097 RepID=A0A150GAV2_GONPE|nr:hypothetical protein GPECTOR_39g442 [Gonium pectorale]|eukprot:KXZ46948.1 hypothetical protein GPECTOR_39g442 [Gonium pectorale]
MAEEQKSLAFTFQKKKVVQKVAVNVEERKDAGQLITGFDGTKAQVVGGDASSDGKTYVIPKLENTFKTGVGPKKFTPTFKPPSNDAVKVADGEDKFVQAASTVPVITEYGLHLRDVKSEDRAQGAGPGGASTTAAVLEERAYREAVEELPDVADVEAYEAMPIEEFGRAMLRGMGWEDGMGVGRNRKKVDAIEYVRRPERLGLGAQPVKLGEDPSKTVKMGDKPRKQDLVLAPDANGRQRNVRTLDEQLVPRSAVLPGPQPSKAMRVISGPHAGLACTVLEALPRAEGQPERWRVRLAASDVDVEVAAAELGEKWEREPAQRQGAGTANGANGAGGSDPGPWERSGSADKERGADRERERRSREGRDEELEEAGPRSRHGEGEERDGGRGGSRGHERDGQRDAESRRDRDAAREDDRERERDDGGGKRKHRDRDDGEEGRHSKKHHKREKRDKHEKKEKRDKHGKKERRHKGASSSGSEDEEGGSGREEEQRRGPTWLFPSIQVRIVDKRVRGGKLYLKKGRVVDVHPGGSADVHVDDTGDVLRLAESSLETVVPKHEGAAVLVVAGPHRGARGRLLQASVSAGAAAVQLAADFTIVRLMLDDVAGFLGEVDDD